MQALPYQLPVPVKILPFWILPRAGTGKLIVVTFSNLGWCLGFRYVSFYNFTFALAERSVVDEIEAEVKRLSNLWLDWFREKHSAPQQIRIDFLISIPRDMDGQSVSSPRFRVHTCELTECGGATCGLEVVPRTVAVVNECLGLTEGFPKPLPPFAEIPPSEYPRKSTGRERNERSDRQKTQSNDGEQQAHGSLPYPKLAIFFALLAMLWPRLKKVGNAHQNRLLMSALPLIYQSSVFAIVAWAVRDKIRDTWMR